MKKLLDKPKEIKEKKKSTLKYIDLNSEEDESESDEKPKTKKTKNKITDKIDFLE